MIAKKRSTPSGLAHGELVNQGFHVTVNEAKEANWHMHVLLHGLMHRLLDSTVGQPLATLEQIRIPIEDAPDPDTIGLPASIDIG
jgi:hypothetical protein